MLNYALTKKQKKILDFIVNFIRDNGYSPSYRKIAASCGLSSAATIHQHVQALIEKDYIQKNTENGKNILIPNKKIMRLKPSIELPLLGLIAAGSPIEAIEGNETFAVPADLVGDENSYVLQVKGESMIDDGILDGDYVIIERCFSPNNGDVVVALLDNAYVTLKRYYREQNFIRLQPANSTMKPILVKNPAIQGVVRAVIRKFGCGQLHSRQLLSSSY